MQRLLRRAGANVFGAPLTSIAGLVIIVAAASRWYITGEWDPAVFAAGLGLLISPDGPLKQGR
jgi:hypothetical protein